MASCTHSNSSPHYNMYIMWTHGVRKVSFVGGEGGRTEINGESPYQPCATILPLFITNYKIASLPNTRLTFTWSETYLKPFQVFIKSTGANKLVRRQWLFRVSLQWQESHHMHAVYNTCMQGELQAGSSRRSVYHCLVLLGDNQFSLNVCSAKLHSHF